jgi:hypothetical protein
LTTQGKTWAGLVCKTCGVPRSLAVCYPDYQELKRTGVRKPAAHCKACYNDRKSVKEREKRRVRDPEKKRADHRRLKLRNYGLTQEDYDRMVEEQKGVCWLCSKPNQNGMPLAVDHDHSCCSGRTSCGKCVRRLLCHKCNSALGLLNDDVGLLLAAALYLEERKVEKVDAS